MLEYCLYFAVLILIGYFLFFCNLNYWKSRNVPQNKPLPIIGNLLPLLSGKLNMNMLLEEGYKKFDAPYFGMFMFHKHMLVVKDPELIKIVLVQDFNKFQNHSFKSYEKIDPIAFNSLFSARNPRWKLIRSKMTPMFSVTKIKMMLQNMIKGAECMMEYLEKRVDQTLEFKDVSSRYASDILTLCAFGINAKSFKCKNPEFLEAGKRMFSTNATRNFAQLCYFFIPSLIPIFNIKFIDGQAAEFLKKAFLEVIESRKKLKTNVNDFIDHISRLKEDHELAGIVQCVDDVIVSQAISFFTAGFEPINVLISFTLHELAVHSDIQERLRNEICKYKDFSYESINELEYLDMVVQESLRKYPFAPGSTREATDNYTFQKTGLTISKGTTVFIPFKPLQYDPKYFPDPDKFDPERFNKTNKSKIEPFTFMPFGDGPRNCIGGKFALLASKVALIYIIKGFCVETTPETSIPIKINMKTNLLAPEKGIFLKLTKLKIS